MAFPPFFPLKVLFWGEKILNDQKNYTALIKNGSFPLP